MKYNFDPKELTSEKSLWDVYRLSLKLKPSKAHVNILLLTTVLVAINALYLEHDIQLMLATVRKWAEFGFNFSITTLGFLIAGFTIFATLSKPDMMLAMMDFEDSETGMKTLKYNFVAFMKVFIAYIAIAMLFLSIIIFGQPGGLMGNIVALLPKSKCITEVLVKLSYIYVSISFVYLLLILQNFIFNIYAIVMNVLRWEHHCETEKFEEEQRLKQVKEKNP